jgi:hypothetical protein
MAPLLTTEELQRCGESTSGLDSYQTDLHLAQTIIPKNHIIFRWATLRHLPNRKRAANRHRRRMLSITTTTGSSTNTKHVANRDAVNPSQH